MKNIFTLVLLSSSLALAQTPPPASATAAPAATPAPSLNNAAAPVVAEIGMINQMHGDVILTRDNQETAAKVGLKIRSGDMITTNSHAAAKLVMRDHNILSLSENSSISFAEYSNTSVLLDTKGSIHAEVHQKYDDSQATFRLRTPSAVSGVRGTEFLAEQHHDYSVFTTFDGTVQVGDTMQGKQIQNATLVAKGEQIEQWQGAKAEAPVKLAPGQLSKLQSRAKSMKMRVSKNHETNGPHTMAPKPPPKRHGK